MTAGVTNRAPRPAPNVPVTLEIDGHEIETHRRDIGANASTSVAFAPFTLAEPTVRGVVQAGTDPLAGRQHVPLRPHAEPAGLGAGRRQRRRRRRRASTCPRRSASATRRRSRSRPCPAARVTPAMLDTRVGRDPERRDGAARPAGGALKRFVERGGGLLVALGERSAWPASETNLLPGKLGAPSIGPAAAARRSASRLQPSGLRDLQGAAQRRLLGGARLPLPRARDRRRTIACSRASTTARWRRRSGASAPAASSPGRRRSTTRGPTCRRSRSTCRSCISS